MRIRDEINHGDYNDVRIVEISPTLDAWCDLLNSGPYGGGNVATRTNQFAIEAWSRFIDTGKSDFGWRRFTLLREV